MKRQDYIATLAVFFGIVCAQAQKLLVVKVDPAGTVYSRVGDQLNVTCEVNRNMEYLLKNDVTIAIKAARGEVTLTRNAYKFQSDSVNYSINIEPIIGNGIKLSLFVRNVTDLFDGKIICRAKEAPDTIAEADVDIVIMRPIDTLHLMLDAADPVTESITDAIKLDPGSHSITCVAEGSNPEARVYLYLDDRNITTAKTKSEKMHSDVTKFRTTLTAYVKITRSQSVKCIAESRAGGNRSVEIPVEIKNYNLTINCTEFEASKGQKNVVLSCMVDYGDLDITGFRYSLGSKEYNSEGNHNDEFVQVSKEQLSENVARVHLKLAESEDMHFKTEFYLLVQHSDGRVTRYSVRLNQISGKGGLLSTEVSTILLTCAVGWGVLYLNVRQD